jgi:DNA-binding beta-propeller fold protein YncE
MKVEAGALLSGIVVVLLGVFACGAGSSAPTSLPATSQYGFALTIDPTAVNASVPVDRQLTTNVVPMNLTTGAAGSPIRMVGNPSVMAITPNGKTAYVIVTGYSPGSLTGVIAVDLVKKTPGVLIHVGGDPQDIAITPDGKTAYVSVWTGSVGINDIVVPIDVTSNTSGTPIPMAGNPGTIAITSDGKTAYVAVVAIDHDGPSGIVPIDVATNTPGTPIVLGGNLSGANRGDNLGDPTAIAISSDRTKAYVLASVRGDDGVVPIDLVAKIPGALIPVAGALTALALSPDGKAAYVTAAGHSAPNTAGVVQEYGGVVPIDLTTNTAGRLIPTPGDSFELAISHDGKEAFVTVLPRGAVPDSSGWLAPILVPINLATHASGTRIRFQGILKTIVIAP